MFTKMRLNALLKKVQKAQQMREQRASDADTKNEIVAHLNLGKFYDAHLYDKKIPNAEWLGQECYRAAASLGDIRAQYICAVRFMEKGKFWDRVAASTYGAAIHQKYAAGYYDEAYAFIDAAEKQDYPLAVRLHGMALANGWGRSQDLDKGYELVIKSIDLEGSWDKANEIFKKLGLNSAGFFNALRTHQSKR